MNYRIEWLENDKYGIKVFLSREDGSKLQAVLGKEFNGQDLMAGHTIEGTEWTSPKNGKIYIFPPKEDKHTAYQYKPVYGAKQSPQTAIKEAMQKKEASIEKFQDSKEQSIKLASCQRDSVLLVVAEINASRGVAEDWNEKDIKEKIIKWRNWFLLSDEFNNVPPFE